MGRAVSLSRGSARLEACRRPYRAARPPAQLVANRKVARATNTGYNTHCRHRISDWRILLYTKNALRDEAVVHAEALDQLLQRANQFRLLRPAEEIELAQRIERGDLVAKERLINCKLRLVVSIARRYQGHGLTLGDLVQEGMLGLIRAAEKFDWRKGFRFSTYATLWIRQAIQRGLENSSRTIRLPVHIAQRERKINRTERELATKLGREPTEDAIAEAVELPVDQVIEIRKAARPLTSLDQPVGDDGETAFGDLLASNAPNPEDEVVSDAGTSAVQEAVNRLP